MRTIRGPPAPGSLGLPKPKPQLKRVLASHCAAPRPLLRRPPAGRSLLTLSLLLSNPVVMLKGGAELARNIAPSLKPAIRFVFNNTNNRWRTSSDEGPLSP